MFLEFIFKENRLFTLLKLGFASQNCGCTLMLQEKLKASPESEPPAKSSPPKSMKPPEWPSSLPPPYPQPQPQLPGNPEPEADRGGYMEPQSAESGRTLVDPPKLQTLQYWSFSSADLYNWKTNHPLSQRIPNASQGWWSSLCSLISLLGMIVNSCCRCSSQPKSERI